jgi:hypothetical protein
MYPYWKEFAGCVRLAFPSLRRKNAPRVGSKAEMRSNRLALPLTGAKGLRNR